MKNLLIILCSVLLPALVIAQSNSSSNTIKLNNPQLVEFAIKKIDSKTLLDTKMATIHPTTKIVNSKLKAQPEIAIKAKKTKVKPKAVKKD